MRNVYKKFLKGFNTLNLICGCGFLTVTVILCILGVAVRYIPGFYLKGTEELARYGFIWTMFCGVTVVTSRKTHPAISILHDALPERMRRWYAVFLDLVMVVFAAWIMVYYGIVTTIKQSLYLSPSHRINLGYIYASIPFAGVGMTLNLLDDIIDRVAEIVGKGHQEKGAEE